MWTLISNVYYILGTDLTHTPSGSTSQTRVLKSPRPKEPDLRGCFGVRERFECFVFTIVLASLANLHHNG